MPTAKLQPGRGVAAGEHRRQRFRRPGQPVVDGQIIPEITGSAYVNAEADLILDERDPFCYGIRGT